MMSRVAKVQEQFRRQAAAYERLRITTDEGSLLGMVRASQVEASDRVLDVACGPAFLTMAYAQECGVAVGIDATDTFIAHAAAEAARRGLGNTRFLLGDVNRLPFPAGAFDVAVCRAAFHHFPEPGVVLEEMARVLRPRGRIVIADMLASEDPAKAAYHNRIERLCDPTHTNALSESAFERLFAQRGLTVQFKATRDTDFELEDWMSHGGPSAEAAAEIRRLMRDSIEVDRSGLNVRIETGQIHYTLPGAGFLLTKQTAASA